MNGQSILIVESGLMDQKMVSDALQKEGFNVRLAFDTQEALGMLIEKQPCVILVGESMSKLDSCMFTRILKNDIQTSCIKIIILSYKSPDQERMIHCGFDGMINMKESKDSFVKKIRKILKKK